MLTEEETASMKNPKSEAQLTIPGLEYLKCDRIDPYASEGPTVIKIALSIKVSVVETEFAVMGIIRNLYISR